LSSWIVSNVPPWLLLLVLVVLVAGGAALAQNLLRRRFPALSEDTHNDATRFAFGVVGAAYAFFIGFFASALWSQINSEDEQARTEGAAGVQLARDSAAFDNADGDRIRQAVQDYERAALAEWPVSANGGSYPEADKALQRLFAAYEHIQPHSDVQKTFLARSFTNLDKVSQARTARLIQAQTAGGPPWSLWAVILLVSGLVVGCSIVYGVESPRTHYAMVGTVGVLVAANLFLILELAHPYIGEVATSPQPLREVITVLSVPAT
jgi:Protein of unknown function (DUF4239)